MCVHNIIAYPLASCLKSLYNFYSIAFSFYSHIHSPISMEFLECPPPWVLIIYMMYIVRVYMSRFLAVRYLQCYHFHAYTHTTFSIRSDYVDISREFYSDPEGWLQGKFPNANAPLPSHLVLFDVLVPVSSSLCKPKCLFVIVCIILFFCRKLLQFYPSFTMKRYIITGLVQECSC